MKNPFTKLASGFKSTFMKDRNKIQNEDKKKSGTPAEIRRGKGGGGTPMPNVSLEDNEIKKEDSVYSSRNRKNYYKRFDSSGERKNSNQKKYSNKRRARNKRTANSIRMNRIYDKTPGKKS
jgi:hypothetical protein